MCVENILTMPVYSVCLFVLFADEIFFKRVSWLNLQLIKFWWPKVKKGSLVDNISKKT